MFDLIFSIALVFMFWGAGYACTGKFMRRLPKLDIFLLSFGIGYGLYSILTLIAGLFGCLNPLLFLFLMASGTGLFMANLGFFRGVLGGIKNFLSIAKSDIFCLTLLILALVFFVLNTFVSFAPVSSMDALVYHYTLPKLYLKAQKIYEMKGYLYAHLPQLSEMINLFIMGLRNETAAAAFNSYFGILLALLTFSLGRRFFDKKEAFLAAAFFYCSALVTWEATGGFVELPLAYYCILAIYMTHLYFEEKDVSYAFLSGIFLGLAFSIKFLAVSFLGIISVLFFFNFLKMKTWRFNIAKVFLTVSLAALVSGAWWYVFNLVTTGNPVFPFFNGLFGSPDWNEAADSILKESNKLYGFGNDLKSFAALPFNITFRGMSFDHGELIGPLVLGFIPFAFLKKDCFKKVFFLSWAIALYLVVWFMTTQQTRFLMPVLPLGLLLAAVALKNLSMGSRPVRFLAKGWVVLFLTFSLGISAFFSGKFVKVVAGLENRDEFLKKMVWGYEAISWMNRNLSKNDKVLYSARSQFYMDIPYVTGAAGEQGFLDYSKFKDAASLYEKLKSLGITHIYVWGYYVVGMDESLWDSLAEHYLIKIYSRVRNISSRRSTQLSDLEERTSVYRLK